MFAKLKKKIEEENQTELGRVLPPTVTPVISRSGSESSPRSSTLSLVADGHQSASSHSNYPRGSVGDLVGAFKKKEEECSSGNESDKSSEAYQKSKRKSEIQFLQSKVSDLNIQIKEQRENIRSQQEQHHNILCRKEQEWKDKLTKLEKEKADLKTQLQEIQNRLDKFVENQENKDELESFQNQEMSKIKHLLLKSQQDLRGYEDTIRTKENELKDSNSKIRQLESIVESLEQQLSNANSNLSQIHNLHAEKAQLEEEVDHLKQDSLKTANRMTHLEKTLSDLTDEYDALKHTYEVYKNKTSSILEEKDNSITYLEDRIAVLEKRLEDSTLIGDEKEQALIKERISLEKKLEESRQHLNDIKTTWSEKINSLEIQIYHLNKKMADDSQECSRLEKELDDVKKLLSTKEEEVWKMEEIIQEKDKELTNLRLTNEKQIQDLKVSNQTIQEELQSQTKQLETELDQTKQEWNKERHEAQTRINELVATQTEYVEKELEVEKQLTQLENENQKLKVSLLEREKECIHLTETITDYKQKLEETQIKFDKLQKDHKTTCSSEEHLQSVLHEREMEIQNITHEKDNLLVRNAELSHQLELVKQDLKQEQILREREKEGSEEKIESLERELESTKKSKEELECVIIENTENSEHVKQLKSTLSDLEIQLNDKNKIIKLQQLRLSDMKKTLQKELKVQSTVDSISQIDSGDIPMIQPTDGRVSSGWSQGKDAIPNRKLNHIDGEDDINFQYLKHVIFKFMTSEDYEAQHLIRAISVLLRFTSEEEKLIKQMMEWKMSWFRTRPCVKSHPLLS